MEEVESIEEKLWKVKIQIKYFWSNIEIAKAFTQH